MPARAMGQGGAVGVNEVTKGAAQGNGFVLEIEGAGELFDILLRLLVDARLHEFRESEFCHGPFVAHRVRAGKVNFRHGLRDQDLTDAEEIFVS